MTVDTIPQRKTPSKPAALDRPTCIHCGKSDSPRRWRPLFCIYQSQPIHFFHCKRCGLIFKDPSVYQDEKEFDFSTNLAGRDERALRQFESTFQSDPEITDDQGKLYSGRGYDQEELISGIFADVDEKMRRHSDLTGESQFRLLEVGCATGFLLERIRRHYPQAELVGVDPSPFSLQRASRLRGISVHCGTLDTLPLPEASFDVVVMIGNFQLHRNPLSTLKHISRILRPGGLLIFDTKNPRSWFRRVGRLLSRTRFLNRFASIRRLVNYSHVGMRYGIPKALLNTWLDITGFEILQATTKNLRLFEFANSCSTSHGVWRWTWNVANTLDTIRNERAWLDVCCRRR